MRSKSVIKRLTLYSSLITLLITLNSSSINKKNKDYFRNTTKISKNVIEYNSGTIYIGDRNYLRKINHLDVNDVLVLDARGEEDPDFKIYDSYKINDRDIIEEIVESLLLYEEIYPTPWNRSKNSMIREWIIHNTMYSFGYKLDSTTHVDFNNGDEKTYRIRK